MISYRDEICNMFENIKDDIEVVQTEIDEVLDMNDIEDIKIALSDIKNTLQTLKEGLV